MVKFFGKGINLLMGNWLRTKHVFVGTSLDYLERNRKVDKNYFDYVRLATLELVCYEISRNKIPGNVAELGVYKGKFAKYINEYFSDRKLYLFDTFEGFNSNDVQSETEKNFSKGNQDFSDTSVAGVMRLMPYPQKCIPVKGFFPESASNINDEFAFVSLDADLYDPLYAGLNYFYSRLAKGGYIFVHDFNNDQYKGARKAVEDFASQKGINYVPIPDSGGSVIITK